MTPWESIHQSIHPVTYKFQMKTNQKLVTTKNHFIHRDHGCLQYQRTYCWHASWWCILKSCIFIIQSILLLHSSIWRCGVHHVFSDYEFWTLILNDPSTQGAAAEMIVNVLI